MLTVQPRNHKDLTIINILTRHDEYTFNDLVYKLVLTTGLNKTKLISILKSNKLSSNDIDSYLSKAQIISVECKARFKTRDYRIK